jgi:phage terminase large subunit GpA-like protein
MNSWTITGDTFADAFRPEPELTVSEWADTYRMVGKPSPEQGPWRTSRVPYTREIMDNISPSSPVQFTILQKAAQGAGTEALLNAMGCWMHLYPDAIMIVTPTTKTAKQFSRTRIDRVIEATPALRAITASPKSRSAANTAALKEFGAGRDTLMIVGANSGPDLRSNPVRYLGMDEVDGYPTDVDDEGDPVDLAIQRTGARSDRKIFLISTPTIEEVSHINRWFQRGDQRRYFIPCPHCSNMQALVWFPGTEKLGGLRWPAGQPELAKYQCEKCGDLWEEWRKGELLLRGEWVPTAIPKDTRVRSYHLNALYYPYGWPENAWVNLARLWEDTHRDPTRLKSFVNLKLGEPWKDPSTAKADADELMGRRETYGPEIPDGVGVLTFGADVQGNRIEAELVGWGRDEESWNIEYRVFLGDTSQQPVWDQFDQWLMSEWLSENGLTLSIRAGCVDTAFRPEPARKFCHDRKGRKILPIIGRPGMNRPVWSSKISKQRGKFAPAFVVGVDAAKEIVYARLRLQTPGPGFCHFPISRDRHYFEMLTSEIRVPDYTGPVPTFVWRKKIAGTPNEALDCRGYAYAALQALGITTAMRLNQEVDSMKRLAEEQKKPLEQRVYAAVAVQRSQPIISHDPYL